MIPRSKKKRPHIVYVGVQDKDGTSVMKISATERAKSENHYFAADDFLKVLFETKGL